MAQTNNRDVIGVTHDINLSYECRDVRRCVRSRARRATRYPQLPLAYLPAPLARSGLPSQPHHHYSQSCTRYGRHRNARLLYDAK